MLASPSALTRALALPIGLLALAACGDDTSGAGGSGGGSGGSGSTATTSDTAATGFTESASTASGEGGGTGGSGSGGTGGGEEFIPTADSIQFSAISPLLGGEQILFNDWNAFPNTVASMGPDGTGATTIFEAYRVWSMGVSHDGATIAFSSGDPDQEEHYGITIGDAIQHTFLYDAASEEASALAWGNINDECHVFSADDATLYLCRREDFRIEDDFVVNDPYRVGRIDLGDASFDYVSPEGDTMVLGAQPDAAETTALVQAVAPPNEHSVRTLDLATGDMEVVFDDAGFPVLSPDGARFLYNDYTDQGALWSADVDGGNPSLVASAQASGARWSPDGTQVVYMVWDDDFACSHVEVVAADGSDADAPARIRDCSETGEFITELAWITR